PPGLPAGKNLQGGKVFQIFVVRDNVHRSRGAFKVMAPSPECFKNSKQFLVVSIIIQFRSCQSLGVKGDWMKLTVSAGNRKYTGIGLHGNRGIRNEVSEDGHGGEGMFEGIEGAMTLFRKIPRSVLPGEPGQQDHDVRVIKDKPVVKICKAQE
ncbi:hypothetical protein SCLCIDRAFT_128192, partial [Scleroderma citrinum Foug A]